VGEQYRSVVFTHDAEQSKEATAARDRAQSDRERPVVTSIEPAPPFWEAEDYHQRYLEKRGLASCTTALAASES
jgi:peptide-methionine (S)-S-oxide reductase